MTEKRKILVTTALPYANGQLHLGHLLEHIQSDIWVRTQKMLGHQCISICGDDAHGTAIMLKAEQMGITAEELTIQIQKSHEQDFKAFAIDYDQYHTTHSLENKQLTEQIYAKLQLTGNIIKKNIYQAYDNSKNMFLPDRYIKGTCPKCKARDQYGDNCEACGTTYAPTELIDARSVISDTKPIKKESEHYFFDLTRYTELLKSWSQTGALQEEVINKLDEWYNVGLKQWDISRDEPYFGFKIPGTSDKYFYVWLDAPIGYMAAFWKYCTTHNISFTEFWDKDSKTELYQFVGKDIMYFHALFWPALLAASDHRLPTAIFIHGFLTINGQKMSKSRGTFIEARHYLKYLAPEYLRYYFAAKLSGHISDLDLNFDDFILRINADLVGKVINIASRCAVFISKHFSNMLSQNLPDPEIYTAILSHKSNIITSFLQRDYSKAIREILQCAERVNQYIDLHKPWVLIKNKDCLTEVQGICTLGLNLFRLLITYLKPVLPIMGEAAEKFLNCGSMTWENCESPLLNHKINNFSPLMQRVTKEKVETMLLLAKDMS